LRGIESEERVREDDSKRIRENGVRRRVGVRVRVVIG